MTLAEAITPLFTHMIPILFFGFMGTDVLLRNPKNVEHRLVFITSMCFMLLFVEEYVRQQLPLEYSARLAGMWFSTVGILIPGLGFHLFIKLARLDTKMSRFIYPYIFYLPLIIIVFNLLIDDKIISANEFQQSGIWKLPIYNKPYYIAMIASIGNNLLYLIPLLKGKADAGTKELRAIYNQLILGVVISACWFAIFGLINFGDSLPPYPYIYGGVVWCFFLRRTMKRYDFLNFVDKRYEKLFNLNPAAILLVDLQGNVKEANPSAKQLFAFIQLKQTNFFEILNEDMKKRIQKREKIRNCEMTIYHHHARLDVLIEGDYILAEYQPLLILIMRDVTIQNENQREITFLAYHDPLTRLPNRRFFYKKLEAAILEAEQARQQIAVVLIDLDYFKEINDKFGHHVGDDVLQHAAASIREAISLDGTAARLGGDEFVFFLQGVTSVQQLEELIRNLQRVFTEKMPIMLDEPLSVSMSIGASFYPENGHDVDTLLNNADKAMYQVKRSGRNDYCLLVGEGRMAD